MPPKPFKPPRPSIGSSAKVTKDKSASRKSTEKSKSKANAAAKPKPRTSGSFTSFTRPQVNLSLSSDSEPDPFASPTRSSSEDIPAVIDAGEEEEETETESIPPKLLTRLLHEFFKEKETRLSADANKAIGKYMETFVKEAIARAAFGKMEEEGSGGGGLGDGFLEVEDLEKLAPQLLMDF